MKTLDYHAKLIVHGIQTLNKRELKRLVKWLRAQADSFEKEPKEYDNRFTARLMK